MKYLNSNTKKAFTLIELLVVIAIIAILAAVLFPVFAKAQDRARTATCMANLQQMGRAYQMLVDDNKSVPGQSGSRYFGDGIGWAELLFNYHKKIDVYKCPARKVNFGYTMNEAVLSGMRGTPKPSKVILIGECPGEGVGTVRVVVTNPTERQNSYNHNNGTVNNGNPKDGSIWWPTGSTSIATGNSGGQNDGWHGKNNGGRLDTNAIFINKAHTPTNKSKFGYTGNLGKDGDSNWITFPGPHGGGINNILFLDGHVKGFNKWERNVMTLGWQFSDNNKPKPDPWP